MNSKAEIRREIEKISSSYNPKEIFSSPYFRDILSGTVIAECEKLGRVPNIVTLCNPACDTTAYTEGTRIVINTQNDLIAGLDTNWKQYVANVGMVTHECGHVLFTDFVHQDAMRNGWMDEDRSFHFYPHNPKVPGAEDVIQMMNDYPNYRKVYATLMSSLTNAIEDAYIENRLCRNFDGLAVAGLRLLNNRMKDSSLTLETLYDSYFDREISLLSVATDIVLMRYKVGAELPTGHLSPMAEIVDEKVNEIIDDCDEIIRSLCWEQNWQKRCEYFNELFVKFMALLPLSDDSDDDGDGDGSDDDGNAEGNQSGKSSSKSGKGGKSSGRSGGESEKSDGSEEQEGESEEKSSETDGKEETGGTPKGGAQTESSSETRAQDLSDAEAEDKIQKQQEHEKETSRTFEPKGNTEGICQDEGESAKEKEEEKKEVEETKKVGDDLSSSETSMNRELNKAIKDAVTNEVLEKDENEHKSNLSREASEIQADVKKAVGHSYFGRYYVGRPNADSSCKAEYEKVYKEIAQTSKNLARKISNILKDREVDSVESGYLMGQRFNARDVVNRDGKYFSRQNVPDGKAKVVFGILVDESGSMWSNNKFLKARRAAILLEDVLRNLNIPCEIVGHTEDFNNVYLNVYSDFDTQDGKDRYRLSQITANRGNIDGAAITYIGEKLLKRPEEKKVLIVISDGIPAGCSFYCRTDDVQDTKLAVNHYRKKKINVFGAIVDDYTSVANIYGPDFSFDCRENGKLEADLCKLVKRYILSGN